MEHQHHALHRAIGIADRCGGIGDLPELPGAGFDGGMIGQLDHGLGLQHLEHGIGQGLQVGVVEWSEDFVDAVPPSRVPRPAGERFGNLVEAFDPSVGVGDDHAIADGFERSIEPFSSQTDFCEGLVERLGGALEFPRQAAEGTLSHQRNGRQGLPRPVPGHRIDDGVGRPVGIAMNE